MDSPVITQLFRQLFSHRARQCVARGAIAPSTRPAVQHARIQRRGVSSRSEVFDPKREGKWTPRPTVFPNERIEEFERYPLVTAEELKGRRERPRRVKMLMREFIEGA